MEILAATCIALLFATWVGMLKSRIIELQKRQIAAQVIAPSPAANLRTARATAHGVPKTGQEASAFAWIG